MVLRGSSVCKCHVVVFSVPSVVDLTVLRQYVLSASFGVVQEHLAAVCCVSLGLGCSGGRPGSMNSKPIFLLKGSFKGVYNRVL